MLQSQEVEMSGSQDVNSTLLDKSRKTKVDGILISGLLDLLTVRLTDSESFKIKIISVIYMAPNVKKFSEELVKDTESLIVSDPASVREGVEVFAAVEAVLEDPRTQTVYVVNKKYRLQGILTINDLLKVSAIQMTPKKKKTMINIFKYMSLLYSETVNDIMRKPVSVRMDDKIIHALQLMEKYNLIDLPVVDGNNKLIGELSGLEILTVLREKINCGELDKLK